MKKRILKLKEVSVSLGISISTIHRLERKGLFPEKVKLPGCSCVGFLESEIEEYILNLTESSFDKKLTYSKTWRSREKNNN